MKKEKPVGAKKGVFYVGVALGKNVQGSHKACNPTGAGHSRNNMVTAASNVKKRYGR